MSGGYIGKAVIGQKQTLACRSRTSALAGGWSGLTRQHCR